jgi:3-oxoacyl-[acyl-carrier-protein] synthase-3
MKILAIDYFLPDKIIDNQGLVEDFGFDQEFIEKKLGIKERRYLSEGQGCHALAHGAVQKLIEGHHIAPESVDLLVVVTQNPDYRIPNVAPLLQESLRLRKGMAAFDINLGCSGFVYALAVVKGLLATNGFKRALIVTSDPYSKIMARDDRATVPLFGDAAAATLVESTEISFVGNFDFGTEGSGAEALIVRSGGSRHPEIKPDDPGRYLFMDGRAIYNFMMKTVPASVKRCLDLNHINSDDVDFYVFHQASKYMLDSLKKRLSIPEGKMPLSIEKVGNTVSSSIPIVLHDLLKEPSNRAKKVLIC